MGTFSELLRFTYTKNTSTQVIFLMLSLSPLVYCSQTIGTDIHEVACYCVLTFVADVG